MLYSVLLHCYEVQGGYLGMLSMLYEVFGVLAIEE